MTQTELNSLLALVIHQAQALHIPVSGRIDPTVQLNTRAKKRFGCCRGSAKLGFVIELAAALPAAGEAVCLQTLAHEVLHTCPGCQNHGDKWKAYAALMNQAYGYSIRRTDRPEQLGVQLPQQQPRYRWCIICTGCGRRSYRQKASAVTRQPGRYRCSGCGGKLTVQPVDPNADPSTLMLPFK